MSGELFDCDLKSNKPGNKELKDFLEDVYTFLKDVVFDTNKIFGFLWKGDSELQGLAKETLTEDVGVGIDRLCEVVPKISAKKIKSHGLSGRPLYFKLRSLCSIYKKISKLSKPVFLVAGWLKQMFDAIDAILDSIINASGGVGALVKEFKDTLSSLVEIDSSRPCAQSW